MAKQYNSDGQTPSKLSPQELADLAASLVGSSIDKLIHFAETSGQSVNRDSIWDAVKKKLTGEHGEITVTQDEYYFFILTTVIAGFVLGFLGGFVVWG